MRRGFKIGAALVAMGALLLPASEARASDDVPLIILGVTLIGGAFGADVAFTAYDLGKAPNNKEPDLKWMTAQTIVTAPQAILGHVPMVFGAVEKNDSEIAALFLPASIWGNQMATFGAWSIASQRVRPGPRYGVSWLIGADLPLSTAALASFFNENGYGRPWLSVSELIICTPQVVLGTYEAVHEPGSRAGWVSIAAWSGALAVHGTVSLILHVTHKPESEPVVPPPPPLPPPPPQPPPFYYNDPVRVVPPGNGAPPNPPSGNPSENAPPGPNELRVPSEGPTAPPSPRPFTPRLRADFAPTPISDGIQVVPGVSVFGTF